MPDESEPKTQSEQLADLIARSKAVREQSRATTDQTSSESDTLRDSVQRSSDNRDRSDAEKAKWPNVSPDPTR